MVAAAVVLATVALPALSSVLFGAFGGTAIGGSMAAGMAAASTSAAALAAKAVAGIIIGVAISGASALLMGKPKVANQSTVSRLNLTVDPTAPRKIVFGRTAAGGDVRFHEMTNKSGEYIETSKDKGDYQHRVVALASHKIHAVKEIYLDTELSYNGSAVIGKYQPKSGLLITPVLEGNNGNASKLGSGLYWKETAKFTGCAYLKVSQKLDVDVYPDGLPSRWTTVVEGCPVYDPRRDSTNGGAGPQRPHDQNTWQYYDGFNELGRNPALSLLTYIIGWRINGKLVWGMGIPASRIDLGNFIHYANLCDEAVSTKSGFVKRYQADCILSTGDTHEGNIGIITAAMGSAKLIDMGGLYQLVGGYDDLDGPALTLTADDLVGAYTYNPSAASLKDSYNIARGVFTNPEKQFLLEDWGRIEVDPLADGIPRPLVVDLAAVTRAETCQRIAKQLLVRNNYTGTFSGIFGPRAFAAQVGTLVRLVLPIEGWNQPGKLFRVVSQAESVDLIFNMTLQEESPAIYAWDEDEELALPADIRPSAYNPNASIPVSSLAASSRTITNSNGGIVSQIDVTWEEPDAGVQSIQINVREKGSDKWRTATDRFSHRAEKYTMAAMAGGIEHEVQARFLMFSGIYGPWTTVSVTAAADSNASNIIGFLDNESVTFAANSGGTIL
ncbi:MULTISPECIES: phage tail protein [unclassified Sphingobium]|uniref:phage tail protein n=1 Tax=unclassified Sphingobium TaxID=2611147 RepID=UPI00222479A2|nr:MULTISPECIES: phage tail protein [unclassified Sphingobium]MCW2412943.1 hypothetical protein [Sphingobium sp. B8D3D]MCW2414759.1 hypothetical protein [Sphingobium sp. B8D3A]